MIKILLWMIMVLSALGGFAAVTVGNTEDQHMVVNLIGGSAFITVSIFGLVIL